MSLYIRNAIITYLNKIKNRNRVKNENLKNDANIKKQIFVVFSETYFRSKKDNNEGENFAIENRELL